MVDPRGLQAIELTGLSDESRMETGQREASRIRIFSKVLTHAHAMDMQYLRDDRDGSKIME